MMFDLFAHTTRPDETLFFHRNEPGDPRLGEIVRWQPADYETAEIVLLGCPQDEGVRRNGGRVGAAQAPDAIRTWLYRLVAHRGMSLFDMGNTIIKASLEETHEVQKSLVRQILSDGKTLISLGGGNDLSFPDCAGLGHTVGELLAFNIDAHLDVRESPTRHSGTPYRMLLENLYIKPKNFYEIGYQPFAVAQSHLAYLHDIGVSTYSLTELMNGGITALFEAIIQHKTQNGIFWGIDMDVVRSSEAPGVSAPNPLGMSGDTLSEIVRIAARTPHTRILELTEVNPIYDIDHRTCRLAAVLIWQFLAGRLEQG